MNEMIKQNEEDLKIEYKSRYFDPETGAHFKFDDVSDKLRKV